jgi:hypothetical protein
MTVGLGAAYCGIATSRLVPWFRCDDFSELTGLSGRVIEQGFARRDFLEANRNDEALLRARLHPVAKLRWELEREVSAEGLTNIASRPRAADGLSSVGEADPDGVAFMARCSSDRPPAAMGPQPWPREAPNDPMT